MTFTGNRTKVARMVAQWFTHYATAAYFAGPEYLQSIVRQEYFEPFDIEKYNLFIERSLAGM